MRVGRLLVDARSAGIACRPSTVDTIIPIAAHHERVHLRDMQQRDPTMRLQDDGKEADTQVDRENFAVNRIYTDAPA